MIRDFPRHVRAIIVLMCLVTMTLGQLTIVIAKAEHFGEASPAVSMILASQRAGTAADEAKTGGKTLRCLNALCALHADAARHEVKRLMTVMLVHRAVLQTILPPGSDPGVPTPPPRLS